MLLEKKSASSAQSAYRKYMCHVDYIDSADYFIEAQ